MIALTALMLLAFQQDQQTVGPWEVVCKNDAPASDGMFDSCRMIKSAGGTEITVVRTSAGATFTARLSGCKIKTPVEPVFVSQNELAGPEGKERFIGGQLRAVIENNRQCPQRGMVLSMGGVEVPELLVATAKLRSPKN